MLRSIAPRTLPYLSLTDKYNKVEFDAAEHSSANAAVFVLNGQIQQGRI